MLKHVYRKQQAFKNYVHKPDMKRVFSVDVMAVLNCEVWGYQGDSKISVCWDVTTCKTVEKWRGFEETSTSVFTVQYKKSTSSRRQYSSQRWYC